MIEVKHLTKRYGGHVAVEDLSFTIEKGTIYGFLGPNGAGKSTTMNIITGCLGATEGEVLIGGHSILDEPKEAKKLIGYLPEQPPVYPDMTVREYLLFVAEAKGVERSDRKENVLDAIAKCGLDDVKGRLIKNLSKGYRQRVGIAQALLGSPEVIILDEPTVGLDPTQMIEIRSLIQELGKNHTVILSSHILSEVQAVCDTIMIISRGKLVASDTSENLTRLFAGSAVLKIETTAEVEEVSQMLGNIGGIAEIKLQKCENNMRFIEIAAEDGEDVREKVFYAFADRGVPLYEMHTERASLEDVFLELTKETASGQTKKRRGRRKGKEAEDQ